MANAIYAAVALPLLFLVPGYLLLRAVFPRPDAGRLSGWRTFFFSVVLSVAVLVLVGSALGFAGRFQGLATGAPWIEGSLVAISLPLFAIAYARGAFRRGAPRSDADESPEPRLEAVKTLRAKEERALRDGLKEHAAIHRQRAKAIETEVTRERYG